MLLGCALYAARGCHACMRKRKRAWASPSCCEIRYWADRYPPLASEKRSSCPGPISIFLGNIKGGATLGCRFVRWLGQGCAG